MKANHHSLAHKVQAKPNKTYKDLRQKQKEGIADWMFHAVCGHYKAYGKMPSGDPALTITTQIYEKIKSLALWVPYEEVRHVFLSKHPRYEIPIAENGIPEGKPPKTIYSA